MIRTKMVKKPHTFCEVSFGAGPRKANASASLWKVPVMINRNTAKIARRHAENFIWAPEKESLAVNINIVELDDRSFISWFYTAFQNWTVFRILLVAPFHSRIFLFWSILARRLAFQGQVPNGKGWIGSILLIYFTGKFFVNKV